MREDIAIDGPITLEYSKHKALEQLLLKHANEPKLLGPVKTPPLLHLALYFGFAALGASLLFIGFALIFAEVVARWQ